MDYSTALFRKGFELVADLETFKLTYVNTAPCVKVLFATGEVYTLNKDVEKAIMQVASFSNLDGGVLQLAGGEEVPCRGRPFNWITKTIRNAYKNETPLPIYCTVTGDSTRLHLTDTSCAGAIISQIRPLLQASAAITLYSHSGESCQISCELSPSIVLDQVSRFLKKVRNA